MSVYSFFQSLYPYTYLAVIWSLSVNPLVGLSISLYIHLSIRVQLLIFIYFYLCSNSTVSLSICLSICPLVNLSNCLSIYSFIDLSINLFLSINKFICPSVYQSIYTSPHACYLLLSVALALLNNLEAVILEESSDIASRFELEFEVNLKILNLIELFRHVIIKRVIN